MVCQACNRLNQVKALQAKCNFKCVGESVSKITPPVPIGGAFVVVLRRKISRAHSASQSSPSSRALASTTCQLVSCLLSAAASDTGVTVSNLGRTGMNVLPRTNSIYHPSLCFIIFTVCYYKSISNSNVLIK